MRQRKKLLFPLVLAVVFLLGAAGRLLLRTPPPEELPVTLTLRTEVISAHLLPALPDEGASLTVNGRPCVLLARWEEPQELLSRQEGKNQLLPSRLFYTLSLTVDVRAHTKEGRLYFGDRMLLRGDEVVLEGENLIIFATLLDY